jgi:hypothetical protein
MEKSNKETTPSGDEETEEGGFLLESLGNISQADLEQATEENKRPSPRVQEKKSLFFGKDNLIGIDPTRELRELRERQQQMEKRIFALSMTLLVSVLLFILCTQTSVGPAAYRTVLAPLIESKSVNCQLATNQNNPECMVRRNSAGSDWKSIERGHGSQFTLHGK